MASPVSRILVHPWSRRSRLPLCALLAVAGGIAAGCSHSDTVVQIEVRGDVQGVQYLKATLTIAGQTHVLTVPAQPMAIMLPTSFTVQIDRSLPGPLDVSLDAFDGSGGVIGHGALSMVAVNVGHSNQMIVDLTPGGGPGPDGGTPDAGMDAAVDGLAGDVPAPGDAAGDTNNDGSAGGAGGGAGGGGGGAGGMVGSGGSGGGGAGGDGSGSGGDSGGGGAGAGAAGAGGAGDDGGVDAPDPDA